MIKLTGKFVPILRRSIVVAVLLDAMMAGASTTTSLVLVPADGPTSPKLEPFTQGESVESTARGTSF
jgi:hypothetical protein